MKEWLPSIESLLPDLAAGVAQFKAVLQYLWGPDLKLDLIISPDYFPDEIKNPTKDKKGKGKRNILCDFS